MSFCVCVCEREIHAVREEFAGQGTSHHKGNYIGDLCDLQWDWAGFSKTPSK